MQRMFITVEIVDGKVLNNSFVLVSGGEEAGKQLWGAKGSAAVSNVWKNGRSCEKYAFIQYLNGTLQFDKVNETLSSICLQWIT